jgi:four helix bundle protein
MAYRDLRVLEASQRAADKVIALIHRPSGRNLLHTKQMIDSVQSIAANISEGFGRGTAGDRARLLRIARGEAEETIQHLGANLRARRLAPKDYWVIKNLLVVVVRMLNSLLAK